MNKSFKLLVAAALTDYRRFSNENNVLIYQMGKVGSTSLEEAIPNSVHFHTLYGNSPCWVGEKQRKGSVGGKFISFLKFAIRRKAIASRKKVKILTIVREPISRNISMFFQELAYWMVHYINTYNPDMRYAGHEWIYEVYEAAFDHMYFDSWFDKEIKRLTSIDVFEEPFDANKGYALIQRGKYEVLVVRAENIINTLGVISEFAGCPIAMGNVNDGEAKWYACLYKSFDKARVKNFRSSTEIKMSKFYRHFSY